MASTLLILWVTKMPYLLNALSSHVTHLMKASNTTNFINLVQKHDACKRNILVIKHFYEVLLHFWVIFDISLRCK